MRNSVTKFRRSEMKEMPELPNSWRSRATWLARQWWNRRPPRVTIDHTAVPDESDRSIALRKELREVLGEERGNTESA